MGGQITTNFVNKVMGNETEIENHQGSGNALTREWLDLRHLTEYAAISERTIRAWIHSPLDPLPAVQVRGKILVRKAHFDHWLERHRVRSLGTFDLSGIVQEMVEDVSDGR